MKRIKIIRILENYMCHDKYAYNPTWTWDSFPHIIYNFPHIIYKEKERILPILKAWERKGYLTLINDEKTAFIINHEKLPSEKQLIEECRNFKD